MLVVIGAPRADFSGVVAFIRLGDRLHRIRRGAKRELALLTTDVAEADPSLLACVEAVDRLLLLIAWVAVDTELDYDRADVGGPGILDHHRDGVLAVLAV